MAYHSRGPVDQEVLLRLSTQWVFKNKVPKTITVWLTRCVSAARATMHNVALAPMGPRGEKSRQVSDGQLLRMRGAGRPFKSPELRDALFDWFVSIRAAVCTRISPKFVKMKAMTLCEMVLAAM